MKKDVAASAEKNEIVGYQPEGGEFHIEVRVENETVWLTQAQMAELFHATKQNISLHIANIYKEGELDRNSVVKEYLTTTEHELPSFLLGHFDEHFGRLSDLLLP